MLMAMDLFQGIKVASKPRLKVCTGYFMQPAIECSVSADKFLDNSIQKQNSLPLFRCGLLYPLPLVAAESQKLEENGFLPDFCGPDLN
jgi:hypothetical protein